MIHKEKQTALKPSTLVAISIFLILSGILGYQLLIKDPASVSSTSKASDVKAQSSQALATQKNEQKSTQLAETAELGVAAQKSKKSWIQETDYGIVPLPENEVLQGFDDFYNQLFNTKESLNEEGIQDFFNRLNLTLHNSEIARELVKTRYRDALIQQADDRYLLEEALYGSEVGMAILKDASVSLMATDQDNFNVDTFQTLNNLTHLLSDDDVVVSFNKAMSHMGKYSQDVEVLPASRFIATLFAKKPELLEEHRQKAVEQISKQVQLSSTLNGDMFNTQNLFYINAPEKNAALAQQILSVKPTAGVVLATLEALGNERMMPDQGLIDSLKLALNRSDVTPDELAIAKLVIPQ